MPSFYSTGFIVNPCSSMMLRDFEKNKRTAEMCGKTERSIAHAALHHKN